MKFVVIEIVILIYVLYTTLKTTMSNQLMNVKRCRVSGCTFPSCMAGNPHYCRICGDGNSTHFSSNCPRNVTTVKRCKVVGCTFPSCMAGNPHYCRICKDTDSTHFASNCPSIVVQPTWLIEGNFSSSISSVTMTILFRENNELKVLAALRGMSLYGENTLTTCGGEIENWDYGKSCDAGIIASVRESQEGFGINVELKDIVYQHNSNSNCDVYAYIKNFNSSMVSGPHPICLRRITPMPGITINSYFPEETCISNVWNNLIYGVPINILIKNDALMRESSMSELYSKLIFLNNNGLFNTI